MDVKDCKGGVCKVGIDWKSLINDENLGLCARMNLFIEAVDADPKLEIVCSTIKDGEEYIILQVKDKKEQVLVSVGEIFTKLFTISNGILIDNRGRFLRCIKGEEKSIILDGVTRVVGYYSRIQNWNASKVGELRSRTTQDYSLTGTKHENLEQRHRSINGLSK